MTDWVTAPGTYYQHLEDVRELCSNNFGPEHETKTNPITRKVRDNHGNWEWSFGKIKFRYEKDLAWFLLTASKYQDEIRTWDTWYKQTRSTGLK